MTGKPRLSNIKPRVAVADLSRAKVPPKTADSFYASDGWKVLRKATFARDGGRCVICGERGSVVDHVKRRRDGGKDELSNLRLLCTSHDAQMREKWDGSRKEIAATR